MSQISSEADRGGSNPSALISELSVGFRDTAADVVTHFLDQMPGDYFADTDHATRMSHLRAIVAARASGIPPTLTLSNEDGTCWTFIREKDYPGLLAELVQELPIDGALRAAKVYTAADGTLALDMFLFGSAEPSDLQEPKQKAKLDAVLTIMADRPDGPSPEQVSAYLRGCSADYVLHGSLSRIGQHASLFAQVSGTDGVEIGWSRLPGTGRTAITVAIGNTQPRTMFDRIAQLFCHHRVDVQQAYLDLVEDPPHGSVALLHYVVTDADGDASGDRWTVVRRDLLRLKWLDDRALQLGYTNPHLGLLRAEVLVGLCDLVHASLAWENPYAFARERLVDLAHRHLAQSIAVIDLFLERFDPDGPLGDEAFSERASALRAEVERSVDPADARALLSKMVSTVEATLKTNVYLERRYGLALRLNPTKLLQAVRDEQPFGEFFVHGQGFDGFHVRFRDVARGGVRVVRPSGTEQHALEAERLYQEAYGLARAQQLKNKDIPEGGAKAVILVHPTAPIDRCVKAFADGLLDLITLDADPSPRVVDYFGQPELLYLGPDENITPDIIEWIVARAAQRSYRQPTAFMSSKPGAGISHKEYGVTSEGVTVFLDGALRAVGIDPSSAPFTVKMTGGPDGDVAGNEIRILHREYGERARIVGIADGSGFAEDPDGLEHGELLRLVDGELPIGHFDPLRLGPRGRVARLEEPDGVRLRNTLHNRVNADAFIPAGGRPETINHHNWRDFLNDAQVPSSKVIVEGANLFITPEARRGLSQAGVLIVKDSSANKCGVICSSYEIAACMVLDEREFLEVKPQFVDEVLQKLRNLARLEADLLFRTHARHPGDSLPDLSVRLSHVILAATDAIQSELADVSGADADLIWTLVIEHLPSVLVRTAGHRLRDRIPQGYLRGIVASTLATRVVYREGLSFLEGMAPRKMAELALEYLRQDRETMALIAQVERSNVPTRGRIAELLRQGGTRAALEIVGPRF